jgi:Glycosyltransferase family 87
VLLASIVNGAHNDGLVAAGLLAAVLIARTKPVPAGVLLAAAVMVKVNALLPGTVLVAWLFLRDDKRKAFALAGTTGALIIGGYLASGGTAALKPLHHTAEFVSFHSFWYPIERLFGATSAQVAVAALVICIVIALAVAAGRLRDHGPTPVVAAALSVYVLAAPYILPWYTAPVIPLLALYSRSRTTWVILTYSMLLYLVYPARFPAHHTFTTLILPELARNLLPVVQILFLAAIAFAAWRPRRSARLTGEL